MDYKVIMAKATAGLSFCPNHRIGVVLYGPDDISPCSCGGVPGCEEFQTKNITPEQALHAAMTKAFVGCNRSRVYGGTAYIASLSKEGAVLPILPDIYCWQLLDAYRIVKVYVVDPLTELAVEVTKETTKAAPPTDTDWDRIPDDLALQEPERLNMGLAFADSNHGMNSTLLKLLCVVSDRLQDQTDTNSEFYKKALLRYNGLNLHLRDVDDPAARKEKEFLSCALQLKNKPYLVFWGMDQEFPSFFQPGVLKEKLMEYGLSCVCAAGENRDTCYVVYWAKDGESYLEWTSSMGKAIEQMMTKKKVLEKFSETSTEWVFVTNALAGWKLHQQVFPVYDDLDKLTDEIRDLLAKYRMRCVEMQDGTCYAAFLDTLLAPNLVGNKN